MDISIVVFASQGQLQNPLNIPGSHQIFEPTLELFPGYFILKS